MGFFRLGDYFLVKFFYAANLVSKTVESSVLPWDFKPAQSVPQQVRACKEDRQRWYQSTETSHYFYTTIEGVAPNQRPGKENTPRAIHGFVADYDIKVPRVRIDEVIAAMRLKPAYLEISLGGNFRLVWTFEQPLIIDDYAFCTFILSAAVSWLALDALPGLDKAAFEAPSRLYCNGCEWHATGAGPLPQQAVQSFFISCGQKFRFKSTDTTTVPLDIVEAEIRRKFPNFLWPSEFSLESQGPTFWIAESLSPLSAIVKPEGMFTFSAHASKAFYSWGEILGKEFVAQFSEKSLNKATTDVWWDGRQFWRKVSGVYTSIEKNEFLTYLKVDCRLSSKLDKDGISAIDRSLAHIYSHQRVAGAVPFVFLKPGVVTFQGERKLNTYSAEAIQPAPGKFDWTDVPWMMSLLETHFNPHQQIDYWLAWWKYFYTAAYTHDQLPGQNNICMGAAGIGKTFISREWVGASVGGYADASDFLVEGGAFNSHLLRVPHWCLDDDTPSNSTHAQARLQALFKKTAANQQHLFNQKFQQAAMTSWCGRIYCTTNLDYVSGRIVGPLDNSSMDKTNLFRCSAATKAVFGSRAENQARTAEELPKFLRLLLDWEPPACVERDFRYGYKAYHQSDLLDQTHQSGASASFKEVLIESLAIWFTDNPTAQEWQGTVSAVLKMILMNPMNETILRSLKLEQTSRYLEQIQREGLLKCEASTGALKTRVWKFFRAV